MRRLVDLVRAFGGSCDLEDAGPTLFDVHLDSRDVRVGDLFVALPGLNVDGARFVPDAVRRGAVAVLAPARLDLAGLRAALPGLDFELWVHPEARRIAGLAAAEVHERPSDRLLVCGITGTNGKTTTAHLLGQLLEHTGLAPGVLGTAGHKLAGGVALEAGHTTPDAPELQRLLRRHADAGGRTLVMEASSHALAQHRTAGIDFAVAVFTNLTREHLDYHVGLDEYARAKARLFEQLGPDGAAVLNADDPRSAQMADAAREQGARLITYSTRREADLRVSRLRTDPRGSRFCIDGMGIFSSDLRLTLRGRYNVENALAAAAAARLMGAGPSEILEGLATTSGAPGRLEPVATGGRGFELFVDYAHSPDALERVLGVLRADLERAGTGGRLIVVFGCGGDRDKGKRPQMGAVAARLADVVVVTSDNPRSEPPLSIASDILAGMRGGAECIVELDRRLAIERAVALARPGDVVLVAGKGHETAQVVGAETRSFDDRAVAQEVLQ
jgi:UDP-N-acetylmuramoyl-L-alanyl-D-glutamate--2,6-diaminopimelate ligase